MSIEQIISLSAWLLFCIFEGVREGAIFSHNKDDCNGRYPFNLHWFFVPVRGIVLGVFSVPLGWFGFMANWLIFPFLHNGFYYVTRKRLEPDNEKLAGYRFWGKSTSTTAKINIGFLLRTAGFLAGVTIHILIVVL